MTPRLMPAGRPGEHLGISHTICHYLCPREMWQDIADDVAPELQPRTVWSEVGHDPEAERAVLAWDGLGRVYRDGYGAVLAHLYQAFATPEEWWSRPHGRANWARQAHVGDGVVMRVWWHRDAWELYTAFRPADFKLSDYGCPPTDAGSVQLRRRMAEVVARGRVATRSRDQEEA